MPGPVPADNAVFEIVDKVGHKDVEPEDEPADTEASESVEVQAVAEHKAELGTMAGTDYMEQHLTEVLGSELAHEIVQAQQTGPGVVCLQLELEAAQLGKELEPVIVRRVEHLTGPAVELEVAAELELDHKSA